MHLTLWGTYRRFEVGFNVPWQTYIDVETAIRNVAPGFKGVAMPLAKEMPDLRYLVIISIQSGSGGQEPDHNCFRRAEVFFDDLRTAFRARNRK